MAFVLKDRVMETTTTTGLNSYTLAGAKTGYQSFSAIGNGNTTHYVATDGTDWEVGTGLYQSSGPTLSRVVLSSSNGGSGVNWGSGEKDIFCAVGADKMIFEDAGNNISVGNNITVGGTVDGRDLQVDGAKLDGIEASATADQTDSEIKTAYENNADTNAFTDALQTKLNAIETNADVTDTTNVVAALTAGTNVTIAANGTISSTDTNTTYSVQDGGLTEINFTTARKNKLDGIADNATNTSAPFYTAAITSSDVTGALGYTPYNSTNPSGYTTYSANQALHTYSNPTFNQVYANSLYSYGNIYAYFSDERLKEFHGTIDDALSKVNKLNGYYFTENETAKTLGFDNDAKQVGVSAQEVKNVLPEIIDSAPINQKHNTDYMTVHYDKLVPLLIEAVKELTKEVEALKNGSSI